MQDPQKIMHLSSHFQKILYLLRFLSLGYRTEMLHQDYRKILPFVMCEGGTEREALISAKETDYCAHSSAGFLKHAT